MHFKIVHKDGKFDIYKFSIHVIESRLNKKDRRDIKYVWIAQTMQSPDHIIELPEKNEIRYWKRIPEKNNYALKVAINPVTKTVITIHFDKGFKQ